MMFKFKNYKILLLLILFAFAVNDAWAGGGGGDGYAGTWFTFRARYSATGEGKVYGDFTKKENATNKNGENVATRHRCDDSSGASETNDTYSKTDITLHLFAEAADGWEFVEWRDEDGNKLSTSTPCDASGNATSESTKYGYATVPRFQSKNVCARNLDSDHGASDSGHQSQHNTYSENVNTRVDAYYVAVFNKLEKDPVVTAQPLDETLGEATFDPADNQVGDVVTLATHPKGSKDKGYQNKFIGWQYNGDYLVDNEGKIVKDNPLSFEVTEDNAGVYYAVYESGYMFYRIKNYVTKDYFVATGDVVNGTGITALPNALAQNFNMQSEATVDAGSIYEINTSKNTDGSGRIVYDLEVQNKHTQDYYDLPSIYIRLNQDADKNAWNFSTSSDDGQGTRLRVNDQGVQSVSSVLDDRSLWYIEPMDKDLETCENYFSLDPAKLIQVGDKYYTTLRTSWNILFNPNQMTPYVVTEVDEVNGTFEMEAITGNIIPLNTPVIIETKSNKVEENRMVPTLTNAASGAVPSGNLLQTSTKYFPNQSVSTSNNYKKLTVNSSGQLAFSGNALNSVNGNEAYLCVANEVVKIETLPLSEIEQVGVKNRKYIVEDLLIAVAYAEDTEGSSFLWCKDQGDKSIFATTIHDGKQIDFLLNDENAQNGLPWDQSNWVALKFTGLTTNEADVIRGYVNSYINEKAITGELVDDNNYMLNISAKTLATTAGASYSKNVYCTSNFVLGNLNIFGSIENGDGGYTSGNSAQNYFFMNPKVQEVCKIIYARWDAENNCFTVPITSGFAGNVSVNLAYNEIPNLDLSTALTDKKIYQFEAIVNRASKTAYEAKANRAGEFIVYPLNLTGGNENDPPTAISIVSVNREVVDVEYVNCMGVVSKHPFSGVNIVVTRYSDGSRTTVKMMK